MQYHISFDLSLTQNPYPGKFYALEGIDGSGKTTQVHKLADYFRSQNKEVVLTKEPTDSVIGQLIKKILHNEISVPPTSLQYLFAADRGLHLQTDVIPHLQAGKIVISDRSFWSAVAYGIADLPRHPEASAEGSSQKILHSVQNDTDKERLLVAYNILTLYNGYLSPDKTFIIDVPEDTAINRVKMRHEAITIYEYTEKLKKVRNEYHWIAEKFSENIFLIDGTKSVDEVFASVVSTV